MECRLVIENANKYPSDDQFLCKSAKLEVGKCGNIKVVCIFESNISLSLKKVGKFGPMHVVPDKQGTFAISCKKLEK